jgi:hypothetical protein
MQLQFIIDGDMQLSRILESYAANITDWTPAFEQSAAGLIEIFSTEVFDTQGQAIDESWSPLSRAYALQKAKKYGDMPILEATGNMRNSFGATIDPTSMTIFNAATYFKYHQSSLPREKIPRRVMMKLTDDMRANVVRAFQQQIFDQAQ